MSLKIMTRIALLCCLMFAAAAPAFSADDQFIKADGLHFVYRDAPFYYAGTNCYYLSYFASDPAKRQSIDDLLDLYAERGFNVIRTWAFNDGGWNIDGYPTGYAYQTSPDSTYNEQVLQGLDYAVYQAGQRGLRLILTFTNNWDDYGGMNWYVNASPTASTHDQFYTDPQCREWLKARIQTIINRRNTYTGMLYRDDPAIFAWELANEPRCWDDWRSLNRTFRTWAGEMSTYIKSLDPNHMVTTGVEGFYNWGYNGWMYDGGTGTDFIEDHKLPNIDFCTVHLYPDHWNVTAQDAAYFLQCHIDDATTNIKKPLILEEFGKRGTTRNSVLAGWIDQVYENALDSGAAAGWHIWMIEAEGSNHDDTFSLFNSDSTDRATIDMLAGKAAKMNALTAPAADVNADGRVNIIDLIIIRNNLNKIPGSNGRLRADVNQDGKINIIDLIAVRNKLGLMWP